MMAAIARLVDLMRTSVEDTHADARLGLQPGAVRECPTEICDSGTRAQASCAAPHPRRSRPAPRFALAWRAGSRRRWHVGSSRRLRGGDRCCSGPPCSPWAWVRLTVPERGQCPELPRLLPAWHPRSVAANRAPACSAAPCALMERGGRTADCDGRCSALEDVDGQDRTAACATAAEGDGEGGECAMPCPTPAPSDLVPRAAAALGVFAWSSVRGACTERSSRHLRR